MAKKKSKKKLIIILSLLFVIIICVVFALVKGRGDKPIDITVAKVERRTITQTVSAVGKISAETEVKISSETSGEIIQLPYKEGDFIKKGALLAHIKPDIIETQLMQAKAASEATKMDISVRKAALDKAQFDYDRTKKLFDKQYASQSDLDQAISVLEQAKSSYQASQSTYTQSLGNLEQVQRSKERTVIFSPIEGTLTKLSVENGEKVLGTVQNVGTEMMRISDLTDMNAVVEVNENEIVMVKTGDTAKIEIDAFPDQIFSGIVREIGHSAITNSAGTQEQEINFQVKVKILDRELRLRPGMSCNVEIKTNTKYNVLAIPKQAVTVRETKMESRPDVNSTDVQIKNDDQKKVKKEHPPSVVFIKEGNSAKMVTVKYGIDDKDYIEILEGLNEGDEVISGPYLAVSKLLQDSSIVNVDSTSGKSKVKKIGEVKD
jgi:HlyD family secretion protein